MYVRKILRTLALIQLAALIWAGALPADMPVGNFGPFHVEGLPILDLDGVAVGDIRDLGIEESFPFVVHMDEAGNLSTGGTLSVNTAIGVLNADYTGTGKVSAVNGVAKVTFKIKIVGDVDGAPARGNLTYKGDADLASGTGVIDVKARACVRGQGCQSGTAQGDITLPEGTVNNWDLNLQIGNPAKNKLDGTATVTLDNGRVYDFTGKGAYNPRKDEATYTITSTAVKANKIKFKHLKTSADAQGGLSGDLSFKLSRQKGAATQ
jgi:hypothetical protein